MLNLHNIPFREIDVTADTDHAKEVVKISGQMGVPVLDFNGKIVVGWSEKVVEGLLSSE